MINKMKAKHV